MKSPGWHVSYNFSEDRPGDNSRMPDIEHVEAYVLNLRFFLQNNEPTSLGNMAELYRQECKDPKLIARFDEIRDTINSELNKNYWFRFNDQRVTWRTILFGMIYSKFAHAHTEKHHLFAQMANHPFGFALAMDGFLRCVALVHTGLCLTRQLNEVAFSSN